MAKLTAVEFWKQQFDLGGNLAGLWGSTAFDLLTAADVLDRFKGDIRGEILKDSEQGMTQLQHERMSVFKIIAMLRAMATECLLKALWLKHGGKLAKDGKYLGVLKKNEHHLHKLAKAISKKSKSELVFTTRNLDLLQKASYWIVSGRYPIQKYSSYTMDHHQQQAWRGDPAEDLRSLIAKLQTALGN